MQPAIPVLFWIGIVAVIVGFLMLIATFLRDWRTQPKTKGVEEPGWVTILKAILERLDKGQITAVVVILLGFGIAAFSYNPDLLRDLFGGAGDSTDEPTSS